MLGNPTGQAEIDLSRESAQRRQASEGIWYAMHKHAMHVLIQCSYVTVCMYVVISLHNFYMDSV